MRRVSGPAATLTVVGVLLVATLVASFFPFAELRIDPGRVVILSRNAWQRLPDEGHAVGRRVIVLVALALAVHAAGTHRLLHGGRAGTVIGSALRLVLGALACAALLWPHRSTESFAFAFSSPVQTLPGADGTLHVHRLLGFYGLLAVALVVVGWAVVDAVRLQRPRGA